MSTTEPRYGTSQAHGDAVEMLGNLAAASLCTCCESKQKGKMCKETSQPFSNCIPQGHLPAWLPGNITKA